jgi:hypothetical protein
MNVWLRRACGIVAAGGVLAALASARAETGALKLKRLESGSLRFSNAEEQYEHYLYRAGNPQHFFMQVMKDGDEHVQGRSSAAKFADVVKKEPEKYNAEHPMRGVALLGSQKFAFVLDAKEEKDKAYGRLLFDLNGNGDLTDDEPIAAEKSPGGVMYPPGYSRVEFPRVDIAIDIDGTKLDYAFTFSAYANTQSDGFSYVSASLSAAVCREGQVAIDGKPRRVVLLDYNSNGRFDDMSRIRDDVVQIVNGKPVKRLYPETGDMILVDPRVDLSASPYDLTGNDFRNHVSKLVCVDGKFYELSVTPAGDKVTLKPSPRAVGRITNPNAKYRALVYSDDGSILKIAGTKSQPVPLPEGKWRLLEYTIDATQAAEEAKPKDEEEKPKGEKSLLDVLIEAFTSRAPAVARVSGPRYTIVSADATGEGEAVEVVKGKTVVLPFGPPYKPVVTVGYRSGDDQVNLSLSLVGSAGEVCNALRVDGRSPSEPEFTISTKDGKEVAQGNFKYG